jgi:transcriptional regulator with GAF, ATPase, and Fis domain
VLNLRDGETFRTVAQRGGNAAFARWVFDRGRFKPDGSLARMMATGHSSHIADATQLPAYREGRPNFTKFVDLGGVRTFLAIPLLKDEEVVGNLGIYRPDVRPFTQRQIDLVSTFASQAVIAIENVRLFSETREALERQTATAEILKVIASSPSDVQPVFDAIVRSATVLINGFSTTLTLVADGKLTLQAFTSTPAAASRRCISSFQSRSKARRWGR